jgi:hypothetical protein
MSRVPAISPPQKIGCKFMAEIVLPRNTYAVAGVAASLYNAAPAIVAIIETMR